uniref:Putative NAC domain-containing protein 68 n=2 Tax=Davidia involucrata TaxID=16924 RepID=A0A5B6YJ91_DAVIN
MASSGKPNFVKHGGIKLPIGFRFHPTDEELVVHYLKRKVFSFPLPASVIPEFDVFHTNPWDLPGDSKEKRYFFSKRKGSVKKCNRIAGCGYWKGFGKEKHIVARGNNQAVVVGMKKSLVFYQGKRPHGVKTRWVMNQYCLLVGSATTQNPNSTQKLMMEMEDWVVCRIYQKKRKAKNHGVKAPVPITNSNKTRRNIGGVIRPSINMDFMMEDSTDNSGPPQPSPSCSSGITEVSSNESDQEESNAYNISFSLYSCLTEH